MYCVLLYRTMLLLFIFPITCSHHDLLLVRIMHPSLFLSLAFALWSSQKHLQCNMFNTHLPPFQGHQTLPFCLKCRCNTPCSTYSTSSQHTYMHFHVHESHTFHPLTPPQHTYFLLRKNIYPTSYEHAFNNSFYIQSIKPYYSSMMAASKQCPLK